MNEVLEKGSNFMKNLVQKSGWWETITARRGDFSLLLIFSILGLLIALFLGMAISVFNPVYGLAVAATLIMTIVVLLRCDELAVTLVIAVHLWIDWYLALHLIGILMALVLIIVYYFGRSGERPWVEARPLWLWILFLVLTIYPAINGGQFMLYDLASYYPSVIFGAFLMFWLGTIIAKDISALRRVLQFLSIIGAIVAIHTIIEATTGIFLFESAQAKTFFQEVARNLNISGTNVTRSGSFLFDPNWNSCFLATIFFLPLGLLFESKQKLTKLIYLIEMMVILVALLFTYSNGSWVALLGGIFAYVFWIGSQRHRLLLIISLVLITLLVLLLFRSQLEIQLYRASMSNELSLREGAWQTGIAVVKAYPLFGVGLGGQAYLIRSEPYIVPIQLIPLPHPHNAYLQWGAMAGIPVLLIFLLLQGYSFWLSWLNWRAIGIRYRPLLGGGLAALIALTINSLSIDGWTNAAIATIGWLIFGLLASPLLREHTLSLSDTRNG